MTDDSKEVIHEMVWGGVAMPQMVGPQAHFVELNEIEKLLVAELDRQYLNGELDYPDRSDDPTHFVIRDTFDEDGRHIGVSGKINLSALAAAILKARSCS